MISIILPTYNSIKFIEERLKTILYQTYTNWECIIIDGNSTDGTFEYLIQTTKGDKRFSFYQFPPNGPYDAWNKGLEYAKGGLIYIATSDDTMLPSFLSVMLGALEENEDCEIAHCSLSIIDESGRELDPNPWDSFYPAKFFKDRIHQKHIRYAPYDGFLHLFLFTIYTSITQLLIRRTVFDKVGLFPTEYGSIADFLWGMKSSLYCNTIHIPKYLTTWRRHTGQATIDDMYQKPDVYRMCIQMIDEIKEDGLLKFIERIDLIEYKYPYKFLELKMAVLKSGTYLSKMRYLTMSFINSPYLTLKFVVDYKVKKIYDLNHLAIAESAIKKYKLDSKLKTIE